jgi:hypothetical protein
MVIPGIEHNVLLTFFTSYNDAWSCAPGSKQFPFIRPAFQGIRILNSEKFRSSVISNISQMSLETMTSIIQAQDIS